MRLDTEHTGIRRWSFADAIGPSPGTTPRPLRGALDLLHYFTDDVMQVGHEGWVAWTHEEYLSIACALASGTSMCAPIRCRANLEPISQSRLDSGLSLSPFQYGLSLSSVLALA